MDDIIDVVAVTMFTGQWLVAAQAPQESTIKMGKNQ